MILSVLGEFIWKWYQNGMPDASEQRLEEADVRQMVRTSAANNFRQQYIFGQKLLPARRIQPPPEEHEYYFLSPLLAIKEFLLSDTNEIGMRRADMGAYDLYRLPKNAHFTNIYMVNFACGGLKKAELTLIQNGEEKFYVNKPKFKSIVFATVVGRGINTFNVPPCITKLHVETTYDTDDADISLDIAFDVAQDVLSKAWQVGEVTGDDKVRLQEELKKREDIK
jgi:hypothetical protein